MSEHPHPPQHRNILKFRGRVKYFRNPASLLLGKVYRTLPDTEAESHNMFHVIDEDKSEPDGYLYPASMFASIELPEVAKRALMSAGA